jgi:L-asparaginase
VKIKIITTGGTIDKIYFDQKSAFQVGEPQISEMLREANVTFDYKVEPLLQKDSLELTDEDRQLIYQAVAAGEHRHIIITHGTDTILETAKRLQSIPDKVIVLTGAMQPAKFRFSDAIFNIGYAVAAVQTLPAGVYVAMNGRIFAPDKARKNVDMNRFEEI